MNAAVLYVQSLDMLLCEEILSRTGFISISKMLSLEMMKSETRLLKYIFSWSTSSRVKHDRTICHKRGIK